MYQIKHVKQLNLMLLHIYNKYLKEMVEVKLFMIEQKEIDPYLTKKKKKSKQNFLDLKNGSF